ncbi:MAG TPA: hypothetical protein IAC14_07890 [Candidatus Scybalomonas excrementigallinarum]|nr:hypothetical protein [Candidatus Scybalomonas excrementigallinarum]
MEIVKIKNKAFGRKEIYQLANGYCFKVTGKGYLAFSANRDEFGVLLPYMPQGGKAALVSILEAGGFTSLDGIEFIQSLN